MNQRIVSAPKASMIASGAITFFFDLDIFSDAPIVTGNVVPRLNAPAVALFDFGRLQPLAVPVLIGLVADHALREQAGERFIDASHAQPCASRA